MISGVARASELGNATVLDLFGPCRLEFQLSKSSAGPEFAAAGLTAHLREQDFLLDVLFESWGSERDVTCHGALRGQGGSRNAMETMENVQKTRRFAPFRARELWRGPGQVLLLQHETAGGDPGQMAGHLAVLHAGGACFGPPAHGFSHAFHGFSHLGKGFLVAVCAL